MKVIFLDVDGVINSTRSYIARRHLLKSVSADNDGDFFISLTKPVIDPIAVDLVNKLLTELDMMIVVSSSHRLHVSNDGGKLKNLQWYFTQFGILGERIVGWTPVLNAARGTEIAAWLNERSDITHYVIIDDSSDMLEEQLPFFVHVDENVGFSADDYYRAFKIIEGRPYDDVVSSNELTW